MGISDWSSDVCASDLPAEITCGGSCPFSRRKGVARLRYSGKYRLRAFCCAGNDRCGAMQRGQKNNIVLLRSGPSPWADRNEASAIGLPACALSIGGPQMSPCLGSQANNRKSPRAEEGRVGKRACQYV